MIDYIGVGLFYVLPALVMLVIAVVTGKVHLSKGYDISVGEIGLALIVIFTPVLNIIIVLFLVQEFFGDLGHKHGEKISKIFDKPVLRGKLK